MRGSDRKLSGLDRIKEGVKVLSGYELTAAVCDTVRVVRGLSGWPWTLEHPPEL